MPWNENSSGGNRGGGGGPTRGPWGQPPKGPNGGGGNQGGGGRGEPPDLEELLQASRQRLKRAFPQRGGPGGGGGRSVQLTPRSLMFGGIGLVFLLFLSGWNQVGPQEQAVKTTFGKFSGVFGPGFHWRMPFVQSFRNVPVLKQSSVTVGGSGQGEGENLMLTSDRNIVDVTFRVDWKIKEGVPESGPWPNAAKFIFNIKDDEAEALIASVAESAMRETIGAKPLEPIITSAQAEVAEQTRQRLQAVLDSYDTGIEIIRVNLIRAAVPAAVRDAFADVIKARTEKEQVINEAQKAANQIVPVAEGEAQRMIEEARAYAARVESEAMGEAQRFNKVFEEYRRAKDVTKQRMYLETMESVLGGMNKIMIDEDAGKGVVPYLPLNELTRQPQSDGSN